jgi:hypothetical protein
MQHGYSFREVMDVLFVYKKNTYNFFVNTNSNE